MPPAQHFFQVALPAQQHQAPPTALVLRRRGLLAVILGWFAWLGKACLDAWEELCVGLLRESLSITQRAINGASAWTLSVFNRDYKAQLRGRWSVLQEQYSWWGRTEVGDRRSTLNAVLARKYDQGGGTSPAAAAAAGAAATQAEPAVSQAGLRHRKPAGSSPPQRLQPHLHPAAELAGLSEIEPLLAEGHTQQPSSASPQRPGPHQPHHQHQQQHAGGAAGGAAGPPGGVQQQWWGTPANWLSEIADGTTGAAAAAQEAATAAVQQAASTMTHAVEEAAATAASWARSMRAVFVEPPAGWGVHEAIKQTGLLEDVSLYGQLFISRTFDKLRWLLSKLTFSPVAQTPTAGTAAAAAAQWRRATGSSSSSTAASMAAAPPGGPRAGFFGRLRSPQHPAAAAAAAAAGWVGAGAAGRAGGFGGAGRMKLRSFTSVDLPSTRRLSLEAEYSDEQQQGYAAEEPGFSDTSSDAYDDAQDDASSEASCSSTSSWPPQQQQQQQHVPPAALQGAVAGSATSAVPASASAGAAAAGDTADLPGPSLTVRVPQSTLKGRSGHGKVSFDAGKHAAAGPAQQKLGGAAAATAPGALSGGPTPFATAVVQQQHQADMSTGSAQAAGSRGSGSGSRGRRRVPAGLGAVLPGHGKRGLQRSHSGPAVSALRDVSSAGQVIRMAGYPLEVHEVVTQDGYLLRMERIPQPASKDAVFMMHGVLDTSLTWVAGGITGSQAFAAWDRGFDVWLGTSRCNPPHEAADPARRGSRYWVYSHNEVGLHDMGAQLDHIHAVKMRELTALGRTPSRTSSSRRASATDAAAAARTGGRRPSGRPSSGSTTASSRRPAAGAAPEHADVLEGLVESVDALVGIQAAGVPGGAAVGTGTQQRPVPSDATPTGCAVGEPDLLRQVSPAPAAVGGVSAGSRPPAVDMARAQSAAEVDQAAAVEAAEAFSRHRAALAAAGISPTGTNNVPPAQQHPDSSSEPRCQQQPAGPGPLSPLTPTAGAAAAAAARAASALGSAVATAAAAAGGIIGLAPAATPASPSSGSKAEQCAERADMQSQQGSGAAGLDILPGRRNSSTTASSGRFVTSGLLERLLGGTVPAADSQPWLGSGPLQPQGSAALRHVSSAPDVTSLGGCEDAAAAAAACGSGAIGAVAGGDPEAARICVDCSTSGSGSLGGSGKDEVSSGGSRRVRRGSCPYFSLDSSTSVVVPDVQQTGDAGCGADMQEQQHLQWLQQQLPVSPFSEQQPMQPQQAPHPAAAAVQQQPAQLQQDHLLQVEQQQEQRHVSQEVCSPQAAMAGQAGSGTLAVPRSSDWGLEPRPYNLRVVCHSLGGLLLLIYCTQRARAGRPHHISRLILLSPAGFHPVIPGMFKPLVYVWRPLMLWTQLVWRQQGFPVQLPTFVARMLAFKLSIDTSKLPAVGDLLRSMARLLLGGDRSAWDRALLMPHYTAAGMPLLSSRQVLHFIQLYLTGRCQLFDYGSEEANVAVYQQRTPPVVSDSYHMLRDVPVHLVAGEHDGVIPAGNIRCHYAAMRAAGMDVSYREFDYGHMDFTFSAKEELGWYVMSLLMRT